MAASFIDLILNFLLIRSERFSDSDRGENCAFNVAPSSPVWSPQKLNVEVYGAVDGAVSEQVSIVLQSKFRFNPSFFADIAHLFNGFI